MIIKIVESTIQESELKEISEKAYGNLVKAVVDVERQIIAIGGGLHSDEEAVLIDSGCEQKNLWGVNIYPEKNRSDWIEFDSMVNVRPKHGNRSRDIENTETREKIKEIINKLVI